MSSILFQPFNPLEYDPTQGVGQLPVGRHKVQIESVEVKETSNKQGGMVEAILRCIDGPSAGVTQAYRLNLYSSNPQTCEIARKQLSALCHAVGVYQLGADGCQLSVLIGIPFCVDIRAQKDNASYTEVAKVYDVNGIEPGKGQQHAPSAPAHNQGGNQPQQAATPSWPAQQAPQQAAPSAPAGRPAWAR